MEKKTPAVTVNEYIAGQPKPVQKRLNEIRKTIRKAAPEAEEKISYGMPAYAQNGTLIYFAAHTNHISLYPYPSAMEAFNEEIAQYRTSKGTMQFRNDQQIPMKVISSIVEFRVKENAGKAANRKNRSRSK